MFRIAFAISAAATMAAMAPLPSYASSGGKAYKNSCIEQCTSKGAIGRRVEGCAAKCEANRAGRAR